MERSQQEVSSLLKMVLPTHLAQRNMTDKKQKAEDPENHATSTERVPASVNMVHRRRSFQQRKENRQRGAGFEKSYPKAV
jgi:hypothetical protein